MDFSVFAKSFLFRHFGVQLTIRNCFLYLLLKNGLFTPFRTVKSRRLYSLPYES